MGLDSVELVLAFEATFGIEIPDPVCQKLMTPRDVIDHIAGELAVESEGPARGVPADSQAILARVIEAMQILGMAHRPMCGDQMLDEIFANRSLRHEQWKQLRDELKAMDWPCFPWLGFSTQFPQNLTTLGDLVDWLARSHALPLTDHDKQLLTRADIALLVKHITMRQTGVSEKIYGEDRSLVKDMGID